ncbi:MAG: molybdopterin molybdotransferase MoeA [Nitrospirae bacterium]|nr:molybdopterin molybdotransferase MoeA [Nitrospirota bacterium]
MLGRQQAIAAETALKMLLDGLPVKLPRLKTLPVEEAPGRICAAEVVSIEDLPAFSRSTVDGYAVKAADTFGATETMPAYLNISKEVFMGEYPSFILKKGDASKIPTGGMLPEGADAVVMFEYVQSVDEQVIEVLRPVAPGENVIQAGEDVKKGERIIYRGQRMRPQDIGACAGIGVTEIRVYERPAVAIISTGDEIVPAGTCPDKGQVRDINSYVLAGMIAASGCEPRRRGIFRDDYGVIRSVIESSLEDSDAIILSGGTSVGTKDMIARIIDDMGSPGVLFHGVSLKPGKPMIGGIIRGIPVFGLPGHPAAVSVCFEIFIEPVLKKLTGLVEKFPWQGRTIVKARLSRNISSSQGREEHVRVMLEERADGLWAVPVLGKSGLITTLVKADGTIVIPLNINGIEQGEMVDVRLF